MERVVKELHSTIIRGHTGQRGACGEPGEETDEMKSLIQTKTKDNLRFLRGICPEGLVHVGRCGVTFILVKSIRPPHPARTRRFFEASHDGKGCETFHVSLLLQLGSAQGDRMQEEHSDRPTSYYCYSWWCWCGHTCVVCDFVVRSNGCRNAVLRRESGAADRADREREDADRDQY